MVKLLYKILKNINKEKERELEEVKHNIRDLKSIMKLFNNEEEKDDDEHFYNYIVHEFDNIIRYPPESSPPINNFDNPYSMEKGLNNTFNRFVIK